MLTGRLCTGPMGRVTGRREGEVGEAATVLWEARLLVIGGGMLSCDGIWGMGCALGGAGLLEL